MRSSTLYFLAALTLGACRPSAAPLEIPSPRNLAGFDATLAETIRERVGAVRAEPQRVETWLALGHLYEAHQMNELARAAYEHALELAPSDARLWYRVALQRGREGELEGALAALDETLAREPGYPAAHLRRGAWTLELGRLAQARASYTVALELEGGRAAARLGLAQVELAAGAPQAALEQLGDPADYPEAARALAHQLRGSALARLGREQEARSELARAVGARPFLPDPWSREVGEQKTGAAAIYLKASRMLERGRVEQAIILLEEALAEGAEDGSALRCLAEGYARSGRPADAERILDRLHSIEPDDPRILVGLARVRAELGRPAEARDAARAALARAPSSVEAHLALLLALQLEGAFEEVLEAVRVARAQGVGEVPLAIAGGKALIELGRAEEALVAFRLASEADAAVIDAWIGQALAAERLGRMEEARRALQHASALDAQHPMLDPLRRALDETLAAGGRDGQ